MKLKKRRAPNFHLLAIDEKEYFISQMQEKVRRIFCVYLFNRNEVSYCCEMIPSYFLRALYYLPEYEPGVTEEERETYEENLQENNEDGYTCYMHVPSVERLLKRTPEDLKKRIGNPTGKRFLTEEEYEEALEDVIEQENCYGMSLPAFQRLGRFKGNFETACRKLRKLLGSNYISCYKNADPNSPHSEKYWLDIQGEESPLRADSLSLLFKKVQAFRVSKLNAIESYSTN